MMNFLLVMTGGALGSALRYGVALALSPATSGFPTSTIIVNIVGSFVLGFIVGTVGTPLEIHPTMRTLLGTGLCGGFTTYSAFSVETALLIEQEKHVVAGTYLASTLIGCSIAAWAGIALSRSVSSS